QRSVRRRDALVADHGLVSAAVVTVGEAQQPVLGDAELVEDRYRGTAVHGGFTRGLLRVGELDVSVRDRGVVGPRHPFAARIGRRSPGRGIPQEAAATSSLYGSPLLHGGESAGVERRVVGIQPVPGNISRTAQADAIRPVTVAERRIVAPDRVAA